jgi:hypothetical protein
MPPDGCDAGYRLVWLTCRLFDLFSYWGSHFTLTFWLIFLYVECKHYTYMRAPPPVRKTTHVRGLRFLHPIFVPFPIICRSLLYSPTKLLPPPLFRHPPPCTLQALNLNRSCMPSHHRASLLVRVLFCGCSGGWKRSVCFAGTPWKVDVKRKSVRRWIL